MSKSFRDDKNFENIIKYSPVASVVLSVLALFSGLSISEPGDRNNAFLFYLVILSHLLTYGCRMYIEGFNYKAKSFHRFLISACAFLAADSFSYFYFLSVIGSELPVVLNVLKISFPLVTYAEQIGAVSEILYTLVLFFGGYWIVFIVYLLGVVAYFALFERSHSKVYSFLGECLDRFSRTNAGTTHGIAAQKLLEYSQIVRVKVCKALYA